MCVFTFAGFNKSSSTNLKMPIVRACVYEGLDGGGGGGGGGVLVFTIH